LARGIACRQSVQLDEFNNAIAGNFGLASSKHLVEGSISLAGACRFAAKMFLRSSSKAQSRDTCLRCVHRGLKVEV
jgi:hypothetical protein